MSEQKENKEESKNVVPASRNVSLEHGVVGSKELNDITREIKADLEELKEIVISVKEKRERAAELRMKIIEKLIEVRKNKKVLLGERNFSDYLEKDIGITRGHLSEQVKAYELCMENNKPEYFKEVDPKVLVGIARIKDKELQKKLFERAPELTREYIRNVRRSNILGKAKDSKKSTSTVMDFLKNSESELSQQIGSSMYQKIFGVGKQIDKLFNTADSIESCDALKTTLQKMIEIKFSSIGKKEE
ncbi:MAG: hypothetical protein JSV88_13930 [Candidatus Aminicenantes bacterium]|nr:MAG: hypothetical protein JSV88_13930 [Candidatus Aminicenantes bacterium]